MNSPSLETLRQEQAELRRLLEALDRRLPDLASIRREQSLLNNRLNALEEQLGTMPEEEQPAAPPPAAVHREIKTEWPGTPQEPPPVLPPPLPTIPAMRESTPESIEMHVGQVWLVRIGIGMLLTGLVFLASFTYQRFIEHITPFGRAAAFFVVSLALAGLGLWLERSRETLRNYGRVLGAGGLAGGYYALYASHYVPELRWIEGTLASNLVLMAWSSVMIGIACWRRSELLAAAAIGLAYYTSILGPDPSYTLESNLILAAASVFVTLRYGWKVISYGSLVATYGTYLVSHLFRSGAGTGIEAWTVAGYWALFTLGILWPGTTSWKSGGRIALLTVNNALYLLAGAMSLPWKDANLFSSFALVFGAVLLGTAFLVRGRTPERDGEETAYFVQGILVVTLGWMCRWHGTHASLVLGAESGLLLCIAAWRHRGPLLVLSHLGTALAFLMAGSGFFEEGLWDGPSTPLLLALLFSLEAVGLLLLARLRERLTEVELSSGFLASLAALLYLGWVYRCVPESRQFWVLTGSGALIYAFQFVKPVRFVNWICMVFWGLAAVLFALGYGETDRLSLANGCALLGLFALEQGASRRVPAPYLSREGRILWLSVVVLEGWDFIGETLHRTQPGFSPTLVWALLAGLLFAVGLACRERIVRWWGLIVLGAALGRVMLVDVWQLETLSRIFTFLGLGAILLVLGFVYNRYQETIRKWL